MGEKEKFHEMKTDIRTKSANLAHADIVLDEKTKKRTDKKRPGRGPDQFHTKVVIAICMYSKTMQEVDRGPQYME